MKKHTFKIGAIALSFLIIGYQSALFIHQASVESIVARAGTHTSPPADSTVRAEETDGDSAHAGQYRNQEYHDSDIERKVVQKYGRQSIETFRFDPNTVSLEDLQRLGFSPKQAQSIINYRQKGGRFNRPSDFAKSYVVADSVFRRLEPFIDIPLTDINAADSTALDYLPGIGPYYAARIIKYREELNGFSYPEQLMDIRNFDEEKYEALKDLICVGEHPAYRLWSLPEEELEKHPYIDAHAAHSIVVFRENSGRTDWTVDKLLEAGIMDRESALKLGRCLIEHPDAE